MALSLTPGCHVLSDLLTMREKGLLFTMLQPQCKLIKTTVAQVLVAKETQGERPGWSALACGVLCLIEDESIPSYFLHLYCVKRAKLLWEQELYVPFKYTATRSFFHTFPADGHQVGFNFANENEAEEFHHIVAAVHKNQEMTRMNFTTNAEKEESSTTHPLYSGIKPLNHMDREPCLPVDTAPMTCTPTTSSFKDLDPHMRKLLMQAKLTEKDLRDKEVADAVDYIIKRFGGLKAVQTEMRSRGPASQTVHRTSGASISLALRKGPLPPVPNTQQTPPRDRDSLSQIPPWVPPPPLTPAPLIPERMRKSASFKHVGSAEKDDLLAALREVSKRK